MRTLPPYNGYGSLEDSAENCKGLQPRPPRKDFHRLMQMHRIVLRYSCRFHETPTHHLSPADRCLPAPSLRPCPYADHPRNPEHDKALSRLPDSYCLARRTASATCAAAPLSFRELV